MVAQRSKKVIKYTYAERVLGALSQLQKEHRKHAVHLATIRAQVRKSAQAKKDELGPQWSRWVGRAVHKLEADGMLKTADINGGVTFTPDGKKAITAARRSVVGRDGSASPAQEDMIWRNLTHQISTYSLKRKQTSRHASRHQEEPDEDPMTTPSKSSSKRARKSVAKSSKTPISKMTKVELMAELKSQQKAHTTWNSSGANENDGERVIQLQQRLKDREKEIAAIRRELNELKRVAPPDGGETDEQPQTRPVTPELNPNAGTLNTPITPTPFRSVFGGRTQSGSFISAISKQPTPAPSTPGIDQDDDPFVMNEDVVVGQGDNPQNSARMTMESGAFTPAGASARKIAELEKEVQTYKLVATEARKQADDSERETQSNVLALQALEAKHERMLADRDGQIVALQSEIIGHRQKISENTVIISSKDAEILELKSAKGLLETTIALREATLANLTNDNAESHRQTEQHAAKISILEERIEEMDSKHSFITSQMTDAFAMNESLSEQLRNLEATNTSLQEHINVMKDANLQAHTSLMEIRTSLTLANAKAGSLNDALIRAKSIEVELKDRLSAEESKANTLSCKIESLEALITELNTDLGTSRHTSEELKTQISTLSNQNRDLKGALAERECTIIELSDSKNTALSKISELLANVEGLEGDLSKLRAVLDSTTLQLQNSKGDIERLTHDVSFRTQERDEYATKLSRAEVFQADLVKQATEYQETVESQQSTITIAQTTIQSLRADIKSLNNEVAIAKLQLESLGAERKNVAHELQDARFELQQVKITLEAETSHASALKDDLTDALRRAHDAEQEATDFQQSKAIDEAIIHSLKEGYARLRQVQIDSLAELDTKVASAQSSPLPKRRLRPTGAGEIML